MPSISRPIENKQIEAEEDFTDYFIVEDFDEELDEDTLMINGMCEKALSLGYTRVNGSDYETLNLLIKRVSDEDNVALRGIAAGQRDNVKETISALAETQATFIPQYDDGGTIEKISAMSIDYALGSEVCHATYGWLNECARAAPERTVDELYADFIEAGVLQENQLVFKDRLLYSYFKTTLPIIKQRIKMNVTSMVNSMEQRTRIAEYLVQPEAETADRLASASVYRYVRDIVESDGRFITVCPECGKSVVIDTPVFSMIAYATESGIGKKFFIEPIVCECGCDLMFTLNEYASMFKAHLTDNLSSIRLYLDSAKTECVGSVVLRTKVSLSSISKCIEHLIFSGEAESTEKGVSEKKHTVYVDSSAFRNAVNSFYNRLSGLGTTKHAERVSTMQVDDTSMIPSIGGDSNIELLKCDSGGFDVRAVSKEYSGISYHDLAVYVTQCLSRDYQTEKNKAIFSIVRELKSKTDVADDLSPVKVWDFELLKSFLGRFKGLKSPRALTSEEVQELAALIVRVDKSVKAIDVASAEDVFARAQSVSDRLDSLIAESKQNHASALQGLKRWSSLLEYYPVIKVNSYNYAELLEFVSDRETAVLLDEVADKIILHFYAGEFFEYWKGLRIVRMSTLNKALVQKSDLSDVERRVDDIINRLSAYTTGGIGTNTYATLKHIYKRDARSDEFLTKISKAITKCDFYRFCELLHGVPDYLNCSSGADSEIYGLYKKLYTMIVTTLSKSREEFYFSDFSSEEVVESTRFKYLKFSNLIPVRLQGETIDEYCNRYEELYSDNRFACVECRNLAELFNGVDTIMLMFCASVQTAGYESRAITMFTSALFEMAHYDCNIDGACMMLGISEMHYNIIKAKPHSVMFIEDGELLYKLHNNLYLTSVRNVMDKKLTWYDSLTISASSLPYTVSTKLNARSLLCELMTMETFALDSDGIPINDREDVEMELATGLGISVDKLYEWVRAE